ncbi:MAG: aromatic amino acid hydroxylase [Bacteriovoracia bacterium]
MLKPLESIPEHLLPFVSKQDPTLYTPMDHASWRYILRVSRAFFRDHAHQKYMAGLAETGISVERIPLIEEMDGCLRRFGWRAVGVIGFIPPSVFMEFQSLGILPIACDMRQIDHIAYTPAPDIVHEAAGHAPILADPEYATYLRHYGEVARKAIYSYKDMNVYNAVRKLSDVKEDPRSTADDIARAQNQLDDAIAALDYVSEATYLARMNWWTVEYGLVGDLRQPLIYGAGLLSSVSESHNCLKESVKKIPISIDLLNMSYDITRPQPQLFVTPSFDKLNDVLEEFASTMAFRKGGSEALAKAKIAGTLTTAVYDSGLQISGVLKDFHAGSDGQPIYLSYQGPSQLSVGDRQIQGQGPEYHQHGFGSPVGKVRGLAKSPAELTDADLKQMGFTNGEKGRLEFESGIVVEGRLQNPIQAQGRNLVLPFTDCSVKLGQTLLFDPAWGTYDMACGKKITSVFGGAADRAEYLRATGGYQQPPQSQKTNLTPENRELNGIYREIREFREQRKSQVTLLESLVGKLAIRYPDDWLSRLEILEILLSDDLSQKHPALETQLREQLADLSKKSAPHAELVARGMQLLGTVRGHA